MIALGVFLILIVCLAAIVFTKCQKINHRKTETLLPKIAPQNIVRKTDTSFISKTRKIGPQFQPTLIQQFVGKNYKCSKVIQRWNQLIQKKRVLYNQLACTGDIKQRQKIQNKMFQILQWRIRYLIRYAVENKYLIDAHTFNCEELDLIISQLFDNKDILFRGTTNNRIYIMTGKGNHSRALISVLKQHLMQNYQQYINIIFLDGVCLQL